LTDAIPPIGFGFWKVARSDAADTAYQAIQAGYRHLDCAADYGNEIEVGEGIERAISDGLVTREELWITSKLWNTFHAPEHVEEGCRKSLSDLGLDYLDLYLVHFPIALEYVPIAKRYPPEWVHDPDTQSGMKRAKVPLQATWAAMEALVDNGLTKRIGVCNYNSALIHDLMTYAKVQPHMLQIEAHPYLAQERLIRLAKEYGIAVTAFSPLGALSYVELDMAKQSDSVLSEAAVISAAAAYDKTPAQIVLRWGIQRDTAIIPKTSNPQRMRENLDILDFALSDEEMAAISALNQNNRFNDPGAFAEAAFGTFHPIYD
jgi:D-xylose reductase